VEDVPLKGTSVCHTVSHRVERVESESSKRLPVGLLGGPSHGCRTHISPRVRSHERLTVLFPVGERIRPTFKQTPVSIDVAISVYPIEPIDLSKHGGAFLSPPQGRSRAKTRVWRPVLANHRAAIDVLAANPLLMDLLFFLPAVAPVQVRANGGSAPCP
jgi:hypothetical protein